MTTLPELNRCYLGDALKLMAGWPDSFVQCVVTSPPYWWLRDYGVDGQIGLEESFDEFLSKLLSVFDEVYRVLRDDGTLWLNMGDCYAGFAGGSQGKTVQRAGRTFTAAVMPKRGFKPKDLIGQPWRLALALQERGWYLRSDIVWHKPNPMPESCKDRPTRAHEYLFLLSKRDRYYYDFDAIKEPVSGGAHPRGGGVNPKAKKSASGRATGSTKFPRSRQNESFSAAVTELVTTRNRRTVWTIGAERLPEAHFATFPTKLVEPCVLAGSRPGDVILDPFMGSGTTALVAQRLGRQWIGCELNPTYIALQSERLRQEALRL